MKFYFPGEMNLKKKLKPKQNLHFSMFGKLTKYKKHN